MDSHNNKKKVEEVQEKKTVLITGGNSGLGFGCAKSFLNGDWGSNWHVLLVCRDQAKAQQAVEALRKAHHGAVVVEEMICDLGSLASIRSFMAKFGQRKDLPPLKAVVLNAGLHFRKTTFTEDGFEATFGVNHLGHFLLAHLLLRYLKTPARLVFVSSGTHDPKQMTDLPRPVFRSARELAFPNDEDEENKRESSTIIGQRRYTTSKLCNVLCAYEFARRLSSLSSSGNTSLSASQKKEAPGITVTAFDPGWMPGTNLTRDYGGQRGIGFSPQAPLHFQTEASGKALARLAASPQLEGVTAKYFQIHREIPSSNESYDESKARELWDISVELVGLQQEETLILL